MNTNDFDDGKTYDIKSISERKSELADKVTMQALDDWVLVGDNADYWWNYYYACWENSGYYSWDCFNGSRLKMAWEDEGNNYTNLYGFKGAVDSMNSNQIYFILACLVSVTSTMIAVISTGGSAAVVIAALTAIGTGAAAAQIGYTIYQNKSSADWYFYLIVE